MAYHHGDLRAALLKAGLELIREGGPSGFTLREAARRAKVSHTAPYRHFRDKADLTAAIAEEGFEALAVRMEEAAHQKGTPRERLIGAGLAYVELALRRPEHFQVMFSTDLDAKRHPAARAAADRAFAGLLALIVACQEAKQLPPTRTLVLARTVWAQVHGIAALATGRQVAFRSRTEIADFTRGSMTALLRGLR